MRSAPEPATSARRRLLVGVLLTLPIGILFGPALFSDSSFAMRDASHFYYPLFQWTSAEWGAGRVPLWNPLEGGGASVIGDASSSLFYPGKLVFGLPAPFALRFKLYTVAHVFIAAVGAYRLARHGRCSRHSAVLAAIGYSCGGSVAFQYCNVVFLVGAAWLPWAWQALLDVMRDPDWRRSLILSLLLALMILGGDPQMAVHVVLGGLLYVVLAGFAARRGQEAAIPAETASRPTVQTLLIQSVTLAAAVAVAFLLAAVQILPAREAAKESTRAVYSVPRNVFEAVTTSLEPLKSDDARNKSASRQVVQGLLRSPTRNSHHEDVYDFSVGPWRFAELIWPNVFGRMLPVHRRWISELPAEGRIWTPTLYLGLLTSVLGLWQLRFRSPDARQSWLSWSFLLFALGALGWYGLGWLVREIYASVLGGDSSRLGVGQPVGGVYWFLVTFVPSYAQFRYPAKLFVVASLALSLLAAKGWDQAMEKPSARLFGAFKTILGVSATGLVASFVFGGWFIARNWQADPALGPFDAAGSLFDMRFAFGQTLAVAAAIWWFLREPLRRSSLRWQTALVIFMLLELSLANRWFVLSAPTTTWQRPSAVTMPLEPSGTEDPPKVYRVRMANWWPSEFATTASTERMRQIAAWEHDTLFPKHHLLAGATLVDSSSSLRPVDRDWFWRVARQMRADRSGVPHTTPLQLMGTQFVITPKSFRPDANELWSEIEIESGVASSARLWRLPEPLPAAWVVHRVEQLPPLKPRNDLSAIEARTRQVLFPAGQPRDFRQSAVVETDRALDILAGLKRVEGNSPCRVIHESPQRTNIQTELAVPGLLVINQPWARGWVARRKTDSGHEELAILRTNRVLQGIALPAGKHTVELSYEPASFRIGAAISAMAWLSIVVVSIASYGRRHRRQN